MDGCLSAYILYMYLVDWTGLIVHGREVEEDWNRSSGND